MFLKEENVKLIIRSNRLLKTMGMVKCGNQILEDILRKQQIL